MNIERGSFCSANQMFSTADYTAKGISVRVQGTVLEEKNASGRIFRNQYNGILAFTNSATISGD